MNKRVKNPMGKRLLRELRQDFGKYAVIFLFVTLTVAVISGFLVSNKSMLTTYNQSFEKYNVEDGHFSLYMKMSEEQISDLEVSQNITVHELFYSDRETENGSTIRTYKVRSEVNLADLMEGSLPDGICDIALDRLYCENNGISIGDRFVMNGRSYTVSGYVALTDYNSLFKNNTDMMFDANKFSVALVSDNDFDSYQLSDVKYCYAWTNNDKNLSKNEISDKADDIKTWLTENTVPTDFLKRDDNQAIMFTGTDMGGDKYIVLAVFCVVMVIMAFIFAVTASSTVEQDAAVIGTLRASGFTRYELLRHYIALPIIVAIVGALTGNILGYTCFKGFFVDLLYHSYSFTTYKTVWDMDAFLITTIAPFVILVAVNVFMVMRKLRLSPIKFLRRDLSSRTKKRVMKLSKKIKFLSRFRIRVITQNIPNYLTLFFGILCANVLLLFGIMLMPLLSNFKDEVLGSKIASYQYILKAPVSTSDAQAEKYCVCELLDDPTDEEITVYGISSESKYLGEIKLPKKGEVLVSEGYLEKYKLDVGDSITLKEKYSDKKYSFNIADSYNYPAALSVFMSDEQFRDVFDKDDDYFSGYFSNKRLDDINDAYVATVITEHDLSLVADQLDDSVGSIMPMLSVFSVILYMLVVYMLSKLILEKNSKSISMVKILGYNSREVGKLYITSTAIVVLVSQIISIPFSAVAMRWIYSLFMLKMKGWMTYYVAPLTYVEVFAIGVLSYLFISTFNYRKINNIPMDKALKNAE